jgi:hypothetical protein
VILDVVISDVIVGLLVTQLISQETRDIERIIMTRKAMP